MNNDEIIKYLEDLYTRLNRNNIEQHMLMSIISTVQGAIVGGDLAELMKLTSQFSQDQMHNFKSKFN